MASIGPVHLAYNPSYSTCFSTEMVFFSHKKLANSIFQPVSHGHGAGQLVMALLSLVGCLLWLVVA
jgi:hypothetical protein